VYVGIVSSLVTDLFTYFVISFVFLGCVFM